MEKQIEEMAKAIHINCHKGLTEDEAKMIAKWCYQEIDRKASDLAEEIFAEIEKILLDNHIESFQNFKDEWVYRFKENLITKFAELKKKYTEGGK
jgi:hypothetical protein